MRALGPTLLVLVAAAPLARAQAAAHGGPTPLPPLLRTDLAAETVVRPYQELRFRVTARDPDGPHVSLTLLNPPRGMIFDPVVHGSNPAIAEGRWSVPQDRGGRITLLFEARDDLGLVTRLERTLQVLDGFDQKVITGDVTGDGRPDVLATASSADVDGARNAGAIYLWTDATAPRGAPTARLAAGTAYSGLGSLGYSSGQATQLADVTGDGIDDVVTVAAAGSIDGLIQVFAGGKGLTGHVAPRATLRAPGARGLGDTAGGQGILVFDLTGDGVLDIVAGAINARPLGVADAGALYVWEGGARLDGVLDPSVVLAVPSAVPSDHLGWSDGQSLLYGDVSGDGFLDLVVGARFATVGGITMAGAVYVWNGGGVPASAPSATLTVPSNLVPMISQGLGQAIRLADLTGDGVLDVVVGSDRSDVGGVRDTGAIFVFPGGPGLTGALHPGVVLAVPGAGIDDRLGSDRSEGFRLADVTGDGRLDVVAPALGVDVGGVIDTGAVYVFDVGDASGTIAPLARLSVPGAVSGDRLGYAGGSGLFCVDLTGDGVLDIVSHTTLATVGGVFQAGAIRIFAGGDALAGEVTPLATLSVPGAVAGDMLGDRLAGSGLQFLDLTGDGTIDVLVSSDRVDVHGVVDAGAAYVFRGDQGYSGTMAPAATLVAPDPQRGDQLGFLGVTVADVTGDGALDVVAGVRLASRVGLFQTGVIHVFAGAGALTGETLPSAVRTLPFPAPVNLLDLWQVADVTGDGVLDIVGSTWPDREDGELMVYPGGRLEGIVWPTARFAAPVKPKTRSTTPIVPRRDRMFPALVADLDGDGRLDILASSSDADLGGVRDVGALYLFKVTPSGSAASTTLLRVPGAHPGDRLGY